MKFTYTVTQEFIDFRNARKELFEQSNRRRKDTRSEYQKIMNADCELLEYVMCEQGLHENAERPQFDTFDSEGNRCEFKCANSNGFVTIKQYCLLQSFDNFVIWRFNSQRDTPLVCGEEVEMEILEITKKNAFLERARPSKYKEGDYFVLAKKTSVQSQPSLV